MGQFGWAFIKGQSIQGTNNGLLVKTGDTEATGQSALIWDATNQTLTVTATNADTNALVVSQGIVATQKIAASGEITANAKIVAKQDIELGIRGAGHALAVLESHSPSGGAKLLACSNEFFPPNYIGEQPGPYSVCVDKQVTISCNAVVAIVDAATTLPVHLRSYVAEASRTTC